MSPPGPAPSNEYPPSAGPRASGAAPEPISQAALPSLDVSLFDREKVDAIIANEERIHRKIEMFYERLDPFFQRWVNEQGPSGLCGRDMNVVIARDAMMVTERLNSLKALKEWEKNPERSVVPVHPDHTESSLKLVIELAERKLLEPKSQHGRREPEPEGLRSSTFTDLRKSYGSEQTSQVYSSLSPYFKTWVDLREDGGLCSRELNTLIARDAMKLAQSLKSAEAIERWAGEQNGKYHVRLPEGYSEVSLRTVLDLAKASLGGGRPPK